MNFSLGLITQLDKILKVTFQSKQTNNIIWLNLQYYFQHTQHLFIILENNLLIQNYIKLSSAASSNQTSRNPSRDPSQDTNKKRNTSPRSNRNAAQGRSNNRQGRRRSLTPYKKKNNNKNNSLKKNQYQYTPSSNRSNNQRSFSRSQSRRNSNLSNKSYQKQTSKKRAWKSQICKYWKKGQCKFGDECEWQHYDYTQIDFCEQKKKERYNLTNAQGKYLVQVTTVQYMSEEQIMTLIGNPTQMKQSIALAIKNKNQSKLMKKEIMKELRKGKLNDEEKIIMKKRVIKKYINHMQVDIANQIAQKRMEKKLKRIQSLKEKKEKKANEMINEENEIAPHQQQSEPPKSYKQQQDDYYNINKTYQEYNTQIQNQNNNQMMQQNNNMSQQEEQQIEEADLEESNLYFDNPPKQQQSQQQQQQIQPTNSIDNSVDNHFIISRVHDIKKKSQTQQSILKFQPKTEDDLLQGTGKITQIMDDNELRKYYMITDVEQKYDNFLIQNVITQGWTNEILEGVNNVEMNDRDKQQENWDKQGHIVININAKLYNQAMTQEHQVKDPTQSPTYKTRQAIISAVLRYMEIKSTIRQQVSSHRMQVFLINKIKEREIVKQNQIWVTGMDKREREVIVNNNQEPLCVLIKFN